jgi:hypothetical protein
MHSEHNCLSVLALHYLCYTSVAHMQLCMQGTCHLGAIHIHHTRDGVPHPRVLMLRLHPAQLTAALAPEAEQAPGCPHPSSMHGRWGSGRTLAGWLVRLLAGLLLLWLRRLEEL